MTTTEQRAIALTMTLRTKLLQLRKRVGPAQQQRLDRYIDICSPWFAREDGEHRMPSRPATYVTEPNVPLILENAVGRCILLMYEAVRNGLEVLPEGFEDEYRTICLAARTPYSDLKPVRVNDYSWTIEARK